MGGGNDAAAETKGNIMTAHSEIKPVAGIPTFLAQHMIEKEAILAEIGPQDYIDGLAIPRDTLTIFAMAGGKGKSTSLLGLCVQAASSGLVELFGRRRHSRPLKTVYVTGEETGPLLNRSINYSLKLREDYINAADAGKLVLLSWKELNRKATKAGGNREGIWNKDGDLSASGRELFRSLEEYRPDIVVFDTKTSLADCEYVTDRQCYATVDSLTDLAELSGSATILTAHITKAGLTAKESADELSADSIIASSRGSAALINAGRHSIVMIEARNDMFSGLELKEGELKFAAAIKSNLQGCDLPRVPFPVIRSTRTMSFTAVNESGLLLSNVAEEVEGNISKILLELLPKLIEAASRINKPFGRKSKATNSIEKLSQTQLAKLFPPGTTSTLITQALNELVRDRVILECTATRAGAGEVWDYPGGFYRNETRYEELNGEKLTVSKGDFDIDVLRELISEIENRDPALNLYEKGKWDALEAEVEERAEIEQANEQSEAAKKAAQREGDRQKKLAAELEAKRKAAEIRVAEAAARERIKRGEAPGPIGFSADDIAAMD